MTEKQSLETKIRELKLLLASAERWEKQLQEKLNLLLNQMPSSILAKQIHKLIHCADPETWDGDIWYDNDNEDSNLTPEPIPIWPLVKTKTTNEGDDDVCTTVHTVPWSPAELAKLQEKYSRHLEES